MHLDGHPRLIAYHQMEAEASQLDLFNQFLTFINDVLHNSTNADDWNTATALGLQWSVSRIQSDLEPLGPDAGYGHMFCERGLRAGKLKDGSELLSVDLNQMIQCNSFLLRLISYKPKGLVQSWRETYQACIHNCLDCTLGHDTSLNILKDKWLPMLYSSSPERINVFIKGICNFLVNTCKSTIEENIGPGWDPVPLGFSLPATLHPTLSIVLSNPHVLTAPAMWTLVSQIMSTQSTLGPIKTMHAELTLPGFILLTMSDSIGCATLARIQLDFFSSSLPKSNAASGASEALVEVITEILKILNRDHIKPTSANELIFLKDLVICPTRDSSWSSLNSILPALPSNILSLPFSPPGQGPPIPSLSKLILDHVTDFGEHLPKIYSCLAILLRRMGSSFWSGLQDLSDDSSGLIATTGEAPAEVLRKVFEHQHFVSHLASEDFIAKCLDWLLPFIRSVIDSSKHSMGTFHVLHEILNIKLQQSAFETGQRVGAYKIILAIWKDFPSLHLSLNPPDGSSLEKSTSQYHIPVVLARTRCQQFSDIFLPSFVDLAYDFRHKMSLPLQSEAQQIVEQAVTQEASNLALALKELSKLRYQTSKVVGNSSSVDLSHLKVQISKSLWNGIYKISNNFSESNKFLIKVFSLLISSLSHCAHIDHLASKSWLPSGKSSSSILEPSITALNHAVSTIRAPLVDALIDLSGSNYGSQLLSTLLGQPAVMKAVVALIFSPNDGLHMSSLALIRQWSDSTSRLDCFRALLSKGQKSAFDGLLSSLQTVNLHVKILPDAMSLARRFVRCMTDVMEIFCSRTDGLFRDPNFVRCLSASDFVQIWTLMCSSVSTIFSQTPSWAEFWQSSEMTDWMRDALIFAEQLVQEFQTFEAAACEGSSQKVAENEALRSQMVDSFMKPMESLTAWLRLNDSDLLDRSTRVLVKMLEKIGKFRRPLNSLLVDKFAKYINRDSSDKQSVLLTEQQSMQLRSALATHPDLTDRFTVVPEDDEDEIELLEPEANATRIPAVDHAPKSANRTSSWADVFPHMNSSSRPSASKSAESSGLANVHEPALKLSYSHQPSKATSTGKSAPRRNYAHDSIIGNLRKEMKASRPLLQKPRSARSGVPTHSLASINPLTSAPQVRRPSVGPHFGPPTRQNFIPNKTQMPEVSSDNESEDDTVEESGLAALTKAQKPKTFQSRKLAEPRRTIKIYNDPALEKQRKVAQARQERQNLIKSQALRMQPDFTNLHRVVLQWDYNHTGSCPPNAPSNYGHLPPAFNSFTHYLSCLEPLLMCECWEQICQAKESVVSGEKTPIPCEVIARTSVDDFVEIHTTIKHGLLPDRMFFTEADLVLVRSTDPNSHSRCTLAKVIGLSRKPDWFELNLKVHFGSARQDVSGYLVPKTKWDIIQLCSLSTTHREWAALRSLPYLTLGDDILEAFASPPDPISEEQLANVMRYQRVNEPQGRAIISALATPGFSLIQGPPGTGKTSTIVGLVGAFIARRPKVTDSTGGPPSITRKVLLCAPSNAAVDEVAKRLKEGVRGAQGELIIPKVVRIGADSKVNIAVKDIFIDELVEAMSKESEPGKAAQTVDGTAGVIQELRHQITELRDTRDAKQMESERLPTESPHYRALQDEVTRIRRKIHDLSAQIDQARDQHDASKRSLDAATRKLRMQILQEADVVCSTLSGSGHDYMSQLPFDFETVVIDEACQCVEPAALIPLRYNATQCILVGDPMQLPPTVLSQTACRAGYDQSLFVRMQRNAPDVAHLLSIQYRMHPSISQFPSKAFYDSKLLDGPDMEAKTRQPWHQPDSLFPPYAFYHPLGAREERGKHHSLINRTEASMAVAICWRIANDYPKIDFAYRVGIITAYAAQVGEIRRQLRAKFSAETVAAIDINTVDGFQGQEKDIIIFSCVRGGKEDSNESKGGIGFLKDMRRMNVALTRAKSSMLILGNKTVLAQDPTWKALLEDADQRGVFTEASAQTFYSAVSLPSISRSSKPPQSTRSKQIPTSEPGSVLLTPKQVSEQSKARAEALKSNQSLKRKLSTDLLGSEKARPNESAPMETLENRQTSGPLKTSSAVSVEPPSSADVSVEDQGQASRRSNGLGPMPPGPTNAHVQRPRPKQGPSLFIQKPRQRPGQIQSQRLPPHGRTGSVSANGLTQGRSVRQRLQEEMSLVKRPPPPPE